MPQVSYDPLDLIDQGTEYKVAHTAMKKARDKDWRALKARGFEARRFVLKNQLRPYKSFGCPDGSVRDVYYIDSREGISS